jgi:hypothetical protein
MKIDKPVDHISVILVYHFSIIGYLFFQRGMPQKMISHQCFLQS